MTGGRPTSSQTVFSPDTYLFTGLGGEPRKKAVRVEAAGGGKEFGFNTNGRTVRDLGWEEKAWEFVAAADTTTLEIYSRTTEGESFGPALDEVAVRAAK